MEFERVTGALCIRQCDVVDDDADDDDDDNDEIAMLAATNSFRTKSPY